MEQDIDALIQDIHQLYRNDDVDDSGDIEGIKTKIPNLEYVTHDTHYIVCYTKLWSNVDKILAAYARLIHVQWVKFTRYPPTFGVRGMLHALLCSQTNRTYS